jgi:hypothetical protein
MAPHQPPVSLSDDQLGFVMRICEPMLPADRSAFLQALAELLQTEPQPVGDGNLYRLARDLRSRYWRPPTGSRQPSASARAQQNQSSGADVTGLPR